MIYLGGNGSKPVSYTHLDVYKRQVNIVIDNIDPIEKPVLTEPLANVNSSCEKIDCIYAWTKTTAVNNNISDMLYRI